MKTALYGSIGWRHPGGLPRVIQWARKFGWDAVDARGMSLDIPGDVSLRINAFGYDMLGPRQIRASARQDLRGQLAEAGLPLLGIYCSSPVNLPGDAGTEARDLFREYLQLGADLGVAWIRSINNTTFAGPAPPLSPQEAFECTVEGLHQIAPVARGLSVGLLLENNENTVTPDAESLLQLQRELGDVCRVGIAFDPVNAYFQGLDVDKELAKLAGHIDILHLKNVRRSREQRWDYVPRGDFSYEWTTLAGGDLDWRGLVQRAAAAGFDGPLVYEYVNPFKGMPLRYWDSLPEPEEAARRESLFLRTILDELAIGDRCQ